MKSEKYKSWKDVFQYYQGLHDTQTAGTGWFRTKHYHQYSRPMYRCAGGHSGKGCSWWCKDRKGAGIRLVPIDRNWTKGYAFDIFSGRKLKAKAHAPKEDFVRRWINLSNEKITKKGGHYPCLAMQFRQSPMRGGESFVSRQMVPGGKADDPYSDDDVWKSSNSWAKTGIEDLDVVSLNDLGEGSSCPVCQTGFLIDSGAFGSLECNQCENILESPVIFDEGWKADAGYGQATQKALKKSGSHSKPNLKVWESFLAIEYLWKSIITYPPGGNAKMEIQKICKWIGMRLPKPTTQWGKPVPREDDAWLPWVVNTGSPVRGNTLYGYPHFALAALMWDIRVREEGCAPLLDNDLLREIHKILLGKKVPGLDNPWRERDVLFVVDILRLMCFDMDQPFEWTSVP